MAKHEDLTVVIIAQLFGLHVAFCYLCGIPLISALDDVYTRHMGSLLKLWVFLTVETALGSVFMMWCFSETSKDLTVKFKSSLGRGIKRYSSDPLWMLIWDDMQYDFKCCGVDSHKDWLNLNLTESNSRFSKHENDFWLPYSCASETIPATASLTDKNIHIEGCHAVLSNTIGYVTVSFISLHLSIIILLVIVTNQSI
jgi:hypothetical protein